MKMHSLRLSGGGLSITLPVAEPDQSRPFVFRGAEGLDPPEVAVRMSQTTLEKAAYQGKAASLRQISILMELRPNWTAGQTPEELRTQLYSLLTPRENELVRVEVLDATDTVLAFAQGQLSKFETGIFTKEPMAQVVLNCDYPYLLAPETIIQSPEHKIVNSQQQFTIKNVGTAPAGFVLGVTLLAAPSSATQLVLSDGRLNGQRIQINGIGWQPGDRFVVDTRPGSRGVYRGINGGNISSILNNLNADVSSWMSLYSGDNNLRLNVNSFDWDEVYMFQHQPAFWGV